LQRTRDSKGRPQCARWGNQVSGGHLVSPWENPLICERSRYGCGRGSIWVAAVCVGPSVANAAQRDSNRSECRCPVDICLPPAGRRQHLPICP